MKKRIIAVLCLCVLGFSSLAAAPARFVFGDLGQHPEILMGFIPSYFDGGVGIALPSLIDGNKTELQFLAGAGYNQRKLWQNKDTGDVQNDDPLIYDVVQFDWSAKFAQGFFTSPVKGKDLLTLLAGYEGKFEIAKDSIAVGKSKKNNSTQAVKGIDAWFGGTGVTEVFPDLLGNKMYLGTVGTVQLKFDMMDDQMTKSDGFVAKLDAKYAPSVLNNALGGKADFYTVSLNMVGATTILDIQDAGADVFTITLVDRANIAYMNGSAVPAFASLPFSLGRKVRGIQSWSYNTNLAVVNNFDIRFAGPNLGVKGIFPRINLFYDLGYGFGNYLNSSVSAGHQFLQTAGLQVTVSFFDFIDLGYQIAYIINGSNYVNPTSNIAGSFTFFLDF